jgi:molybdate transport system substrate-binding protein
MLRPWPATLVSALTLAAALLAAPASAQPLTVSAASSLADVMADVGRAWATAGGTGIQVNAGGSNVLARQVAQGAPVDVFVSADRAQMDVAAASGRLVTGSVRDLLSNTLVVVLPRAAERSDFTPADLATSRVRRVALGNPQSVPAGVYARQWLERSGLWSAVSPKVVPTLTVRAALAAVRAGRVDAGVVFATDARTAPDVTVSYRVPAAEAPPIRYPAAVVRGPREAEAARFLQFLASPAARAIFEAAGFLTAVP